jgi:hypothetical protein
VSFKSIRLAGTLTPPRACSHLTIFKHGRCHRILCDSRRQRARARTHTHTHQTSLQVCGTLMREVTRSNTFLRRPLRGQRSSPSRSPTTAFALLGASDRLMWSALFWSERCACVCLCACVRAYVRACAHTCRCHCVGEHCRCIRASASQMVAVVCEEPWTHKGLPTLIGTDDLDTELSK